MREALLLKLLISREQDACNLNPEDVLGTFEALRMKSLSVLNKINRNKKIISNNS